MQFRAELFPKPAAIKILHEQSLFLIGSCFTEQIGAKLANSKFSILQNPHGILFNPASIEKALHDYAAEKIYTVNDLFFHDELYGSWNHHTRFSSIDADTALNKINDEIKTATAFLKKASWVIITLGSAFVYEHQEMGSVVANCHKIPADKFRKRLLHPSEAVQLLNNMLEYLRQLNPDVHVIFTISPVRHLRDGFVENNRSKAVLIQAVHEVVNNDSVQYFPSYELVLDDLRDYRFFAEDMAHPNYAATQYVWEKFLSVYMNESTLALMKEIQSVTNAYAHKPFNPFSRQHQEFLHTFLRKSELIQQQHPNIDFKNEIEFFKSQLSARTND